MNLSSSTSTAAEGGRWLVFGLVAGAYLLACFAPAAYFDAGGHACTAIRLGLPTGLEVLLLG